jgi:cyanoexosortase B-associated protein
MIGLFILAIALFAVLPNYVTGSWFWAQPPQVLALDSLRSLQRHGLELSGWQTLDQQTGEIGGRKWSIQTLIPESSELQALIDGNNIRTPLFLFIRPQTRAQDQPQVEWLDIKGAQKWKEDTRSQIQFSVPDNNSLSTTHLSSSVEVQARYIRGWNSDGTYAVLQWYAWPSGGGPTTGQWFWADCLSQWRNRQRAPWVAVNVLIPIKPLGDISHAQLLAEQIGVLIQSALMQNVFSQAN